MAFSSSGEFITRIHPIGDRMTKLYDPSQPPTNQPQNDAADIAKAVPQDFIDAMIVREAVFVKEQGVPLQNELDEDDPRSFHWVAYASVPAKHASPDSATDSENRRKSTSTKVPVATIRLVPPPHPPHHQNPTWLHKQETYVKLGRLAVLPEYRGQGISGMLILDALKFIKEHPNDVLAYMTPSGKERLDAEGKGSDFNGLVLVHAQVGVQKVWRKFGFVTDDSMGTWDEEGIEHVGMWKTIDVTAARKNPGRSALPEFPGSPWIPRA